jgi:hypothetical protein
MIIDDVATPLVTVAVPTNDADLVIVGFAVPPVEYRVTALRLAETLTGVAIQVYAVETGVAGPPTCSIGA